MAIENLGKTVGTTLSGGGITVARTATAADWLVSRDPRPREIRETWMRDAPAMLRTGLHFEAVRLAGAVVGVVAGGG
ncbi:hypothetical protein ACSNOK_29270, partial [Streptomyces sp. URMC 126]|uniref:hypothetical protein n=1 Tax=Streptomyces sp. URMC 126 TaxID=3423401 RepID=UPI003F1BFBC8